MSAPDFLPYARHFVDEADIAAVVDVLRGDYLTTGPRVEAFERALAVAVDAEWAVAVSSGTAALHAACFAAGVTEGDEVIVPAITFVATANCARYLHAEPVFADVDPDTGLIDPVSVAGRVGPKTRAMIAVHLGGALADLSALRSIAESSRITIIEDAAHALGAVADAAPVGACTQGSSGATFSFHPVKHVTTGEGGAVTGADPVLLRRLRLFRDHGIERSPARFMNGADGPWMYEQQDLGHNLRMSDMQAALGVSQLGKLEPFIQRRRALAARYDRLLSELPGVTPVIPAARPQESAGAGGFGARRCAYHLYPVLIDFAACGLSRADAMHKLRARGIGTQVHYIPLPMHPYYRDRGWDPDAFPGALRYYERTLSLPMFPAMRDEDVDRVVSALSDVLNKGDA